MFKFGNKDTKKMCKNFLKARNENCRAKYDIYSNLTIKTPEQFGIFLQSTLKS